MLEYEREIRQSIGKDAFDWLEKEITAYRVINSFKVAITLDSSALKCLRSKEFQNKLKLFLADKVFDLVEKQLIFSKNFEGFKSNIQNMNIVMSDQEGKIQEMFNPTVDEVSKRLKFSKERKMKIQKLRRITQRIMSKLFPAVTVSSSSNKNVN